MSISLKIEGRERRTVLYAGSPYIRVYGYYSDQVTADKMGGHVASVGDNSYDIFVLNLNETKHRREENKMDWRM